MDLLLSGPEGGGVIEVKSYGQRHELPAYKAQAARYARSRKLPVATLALFVPTEDETVLAQLSGQDEIAGVQVTTVCIGWM